MKFIAVILSLSLLWSVCAFAQEKVALIELYEGDRPELFVKGVSDVTGAVAIIGNTENEITESVKLADSDIYIDTLILIDNSMSVPQERLDELKEIITQLISARKDGQDRFSIATYSTSVGNLPDFSSDYKSLQQYVSSIERVDQDTRLTDAIAEIMKSELMGESEEASFKRMIVFSDGVDDQGGYSVAERSRLLDKNFIPVYTIGVYDNKGTNDKSLAELFSLSRETNAAYFLLSDRSEGDINVLLPGESCYQIKNSDEWTVLDDVLGEDRNIYRFAIDLADEVKDGSTKTVTLKISSSSGESTVIADNVRMPHVAIAAKTEKTEEIEKVSEQKPEQESSTEKENLQQESATSDKNNNLSIIIICVMVVLVIAVVVVLYLTKKRKKNKNHIHDVAFPPGDNPFDLSEKNKPNKIEQNPEDGTIVIERQNKVPGESGTIILFDDNHECKVILTDINNSSHIFSKSVRQDNGFIVGKSDKNSDVVIDYDGSISREHCRITRQGNSFYVTDIGSTNGTFVNNQKISSITEIFSGTVLKLGRTELKVTIE